MSSSWAGAPASETELGPSLATMSGSTRRVGVDGRAGFAGVGWADPSKLDASGRIQRTPSEGGRLSTEVVRVRVRDRVRVRVNVRVRVQVKVGVGVRVRVGLGLGLGLRAAQLTLSLSLTLTLPLPLALTPTLTLTLTLTTLTLTTWLVPLSSARTYGSRPRSVAPNLLTTAGSPPRLRP